MLSLIEPGNVAAIGGISTTSSAHFAGCRTRHTVNKHSPRTERLFLSTNRLTAIVYVHAPLEMPMPGDELLSAVTYRHEAKEESAADAEVVKYLKASPYQGKLNEAGLFLKLLSENQRKLKSLIQPHVASHIGADGQVGQLSALTDKAPSLSPERLDQVAALPLGARVVVDPWTSKAELLRTPNLPLASAREKASMAITPLVPYLRYVEVPGAVKQ